MEVTDLVKSVSGWEPVWVILLVVLVGVGFGLYKFLQPFMSSHTEAVKALTDLNLKMDKLIEKIEDNTRVTKETIDSQSLKMEKLAFIIQTTQPKSVNQLINDLNN